MLRIFAVWESEADWERFRVERLMPVVGPGWPPAAGHQASVAPFHTGATLALVSRRSRVVLAGLVVGQALILAPVAIAAAPLEIVCTLRPGQTSLPARTAHGLAAHLLQYPDLSLATRAERVSATRVLELTRAASARFSDARAAKRAGFDTHLAKRTASSPAVGYLHAESRRYSNDRRYFDPRRPEALIYANQAGHKLVLIGVMFSMPRGKPGPTPAGPIGRWHSHLICVRGNKRGLAPPTGKGCPAGAREAQGSEMLHVWFTSDLRSAFAVHAPVPELCRDGLLTAATCRNPAARSGM